MCVCSEKPPLGPPAKDAVSEEVNTMVGLVIEIVSGKLEECDLMPIQVRPTTSDLICLPQTASAHLVRHRLLIRDREYLCK